VKLIKKQYQMKVNCIVCNNEFNIPPNKIAKSITKEFCCSRECLIKNRKLTGKVLVNCGQCNKSFNVKKSIIENSISKIVYCSQRCFGDSKMKSNQKNLMIVNLNNFSNYNEFIKTLRKSFVQYHLDLNNNNILKTSSILDIQRSHVYNILNSDKEVESNIIINSVQDFSLGNFRNAKIILSKNKDFIKEIRIKKIQEKVMSLSEEELYTSMLPQYLYYMNIKESEYDESDLIRLPLLIQHYRDIDAEDKVEDLEEILKIIKNKL